MLNEQNFAGFFNRIRSGENFKVGDYCLESLRKELEKRQNKLKILSPKMLFLKVLFLTTLLPKQTRYRSQGIQISHIFKIKINCSLY